MYIAIWLCLCFFFFKQKTAYEMRISDWSSDVCSSDLDERGHGGLAVGAGDAGDPVRGQFGSRLGEQLDIADHGHMRREIGRASCRERGVSTCRSRWSPYH